MKKRYFLPALLALGACASTGKVVLTANQGFAMAQLAFKTGQQAALACITSQVPVCATNKGAIIDLVDKGQAIESTGFAAQQAANSTLTASNAAALFALTAQLQTLGAK
jgi:hypothetical protein